MDLTYNTIVDNGLYVLGYYLNKEVKDISYKDIENSIDMMSKKVKQFFDCGKYKKLKSMGYSNSVLTQPKSKITLEEKLKEFLLDLKGDEYCAICGKYHTKINNDIGRSYIPNTTAHTFYNFSNNLQGLNICPYCLILTMYAGLNFRLLNGLITIYNSTDIDFMKSYTETIQEENLIDIELEAKENKKLEKRNSTEYLEQLLLQGMFLDGYIEQYRFTNAGQNQNVEINKISSNNVQLFNKLTEESLLDEFKKMNLMYCFLANKLADVYLYRIYDFENNKLKCSKELFNFLNEEVNKLDKGVKDLIKRMSEKIIIEKMDDDKLINKIKLINNLTGFEKFLLELKEEYRKIANESLFDLDEYDSLVNIRYWNRIKHYLLASLI